MSRVREGAECPECGLLVWLTMASRGRAAQEHSMIGPGGAVERCDGSGRVIPASASGSDR